MALAQHLLPNCQRPLVQRPRHVQTPPHSEQQGQIVQARRVEPVVLAQHLLLDRQRPLEERPLPRSPPAIPARRPSCSGSSRSRGAARPTPPCDRDAPEAAVPLCNPPANRAVRPGCSSLPRRRRATLAQYLFPDRQHPVQERLCRCVVPLRFQQSGQVVQAPARIRGDALQVPPSESRAPARRAGRAAA